MEIYKQVQLFIYWSRTQLNANINVRTTSKALTLQHRYDCSICLELTRAVDRQSKRKGMKLMHKNRRSHRGDGRHLHGQRENSCGREVGADMIIFRSTDLFTYSYKTMDMQNHGLEKQGLNWIFFKTKTYHFIGLRNISRQIPEATNQNISSSSPDHPSDLDSTWRLWVKASDSKCHFPGLRDQKPVNINHSSSSKKEKKSATTSFA